LRLGNEIHNEVSPHTGQSSHPSSRSLQILNTGKGVEKTQLSDIVGGNVSWCRCGKQCGVFLKNEK